MLEMVLSVLSDLSENAKEDEIIVEAAVSRQETRTNGNRGIVYRTVCRNPGCGFKFDLRITPDNARLLSAAVACPHCKRPGGQLRSRGRISENIFAAKLFFRPNGVGPDA